MATFSTDDVAERDRFAYWHEAVTDMFVNLDLTTTAAPDAFAALARSQRAGPVRLSRFRSGPMDATRLPTHIRTDGVGDCFIALQVRGRAEVAQHGRALTLRPGDFTVLDTRHPYQIVFRGQPADHLVVHVGRHLIEAAGVDLQSVAARPVRAGSVSGRFVAPFLVTAERSIGALPGERLTDIGQLCLSHLATALLTEVPAAGVNASRQHDVQLTEVKSYLLINLSDSRLDPARAAAAYGISVRQLHRLFAASGITFGAWVRAERLRRCREDLIAPVTAACPIASIGARWGLVDPAVFSRMFRHAFQMSPREFRQQAAGQTTEC